MTTTELLDHSGMPVMPGFYYFLTLVRRESGQDEKTATRAWLTGEFLLDVIPVVYLWLMEELLQMFPEEHRTSGEWRFLIVRRS